MIEKAATAIADLGSWQTLAPPKHARQWVDGRSAKEVARRWLGFAPVRMPPEITSALHGHADFGVVEEWRAEPEAKLPFDSFRGEPRNSDLAVYCRDTHGSFLLAVEAKADESYGETVSDCFREALERKIANPSSNGLARIENLAIALFGSRQKGELRVSELRYQLLTACAGALAEAERHQFDRALMLVQEFVTKQTRDEKHRANARDLNSMVARLSHLEVESLESGEIAGPFIVPGRPLVERVPKLYIGKVSMDLRSDA